MKKCLSFIIVAILVMSCLSGCGSTSNAVDVTAVASDTQASVEEISSDGTDLQIVTTIFPCYDWVKEVLGDNPAGAELTMLLDNGVDLHSYQPTAEDIMKIADCDLFIYVGGESDGWVDDALAEATNSDMIVINMLDTLGDKVKEEEIVEGMEADEHEHDEDEDHDHEAEEEHEHEHEHEEGEIEYDEHVWLSLRNAAVLVDSISQAMQKIDADNADTYSKNSASYIDSLNSLDAEYKAAVDAASNKTVLFGDRFPFRYMTDDYGLDYYAAFVGCSAETEASFETVTFLANKMDELSLPAILTIESGDKKIAETILANSKDKDREILTLDSMQSTTSEDVQNGARYISIMENNLSVLKEALK